MIEAKIYTFSELKEVILKESSDSKPVLGKNVEAENSKNNEKAVKDIIKQTEEYNDVKQEKRTANPQSENDLNKTTLDVEFDYEPSEAYKERVKAQVDGFPSVKNEKTSDVKDNESLSYEGNKRFYDNNKRSQEKRSKEKKDDGTSGLKTSKQKEIKSNKGKNIFKENKMKRLQYNKAFINEEHALNRVPDDYKVDGNKFLMRDVNGVEYLVECEKDKYVDYVYTKIVGRTDNIGINEHLERMKELSGYKSSEYFAQTTCESRKKESELLSENMNKVKDLMRKIEK